MSQFFRDAMTQATRWRVLIALAALYAAFFGVLNNHHLVAYVLAIEIGSDRPDRVQVYVDDGLGDRESASQAVQVGRGNLETRILNLPAGGYRMMRLDPGDGGGVVTVGRAWVMNRAGLTLQTLDLSVAEPNPLVTLERVGPVLVMRKAEPPPRPPAADGEAGLPAAAPPANFARPDYDPWVNFSQTSFAARTPIWMRLAVGAWHFVAALAVLGGLRWLLLNIGGLGAWMRDNPRSTWAFAGAAGALVYLIGNMSLDVMAWEPFNEPFNKWGWALAQGRLDPPRGAFGAESMLIDGREQVYFGLWPALLRAALAPILGLEINIGKRVFVCFALTLLLLTLLFVRHFAERAPTMRREDRDSAGMVALLAVAGATVTPIFLSRGYIYHEALGWGAVAMLGGFYALLRLTTAPRALWVAVLIVCAGVAAHSRMTAFLGLSVACLVVGVWHTVRSAGLAKSLAFKDRAFNGLAIAGMGFGVVAATLIGANLARFGSIGAAFPLELHYGHPLERLAHFGGEAFHAGNIPDRLQRYFGIPGLSLSGHFPYVGFLIDRNDRAVSDIIEPYLGAWAFVGVVVLAALTPWRRIGPVFGVAGLAALVAGAVQMAPALTVVGVTFRYHVELLPAAVVAICGLSVALAGAAVWRSRTAIALLSLSALLNALLALRFQTEIVWGTPNGVVAQYANLRGLTVREVYGPVLGDDFDFQNHHYENWPELHRFLTLGDQTMASRVATLPEGPAIVHVTTGVAMATPPGYCRAEGASLLAVADVMTMELGWYGGPMAAAAPCEWTARIATPDPTEPAPASGQYPLAFMTAPISHPRNADAYFKRFADAVERACAGDACRSAPAPLSAAWHRVVSAQCTATQCTILRRAQTHRMNGVVGVTLTVVKGEPVYFYVYEPTDVLAPADPAAEARTRAQLEAIVATSIAMNAKK